MPTTVNVDEFGIASFRKSLYDEEGNAIDLTSVEVVEVNGVEVEEGPDRTPDWLTNGYTTEDEQTTDGPLGARRYLHLDFAIDTNDATIQKNTSYKIRITADDNFNPPQEFDFLFTNGVLDFSTITGLVGHFAYRIQGGGNTDTLTNQGSGADLTGSTVDAQPTLFGGRGAWGFSGDALSVAAGLLPTASPNDPWSLFVLIQWVALSDQNVPLVSQQSGTANGFRLERDAAVIQLHFYTDGVDTARSLNNAAVFGRLSLLEVHKAADGTVTAFCDGQAIGASFVHAGTMPAATAFTVGGGNAFNDFNLAELLEIDGELSSAQKTQIRQALKALYPSSDYVPF